MKEFNFISGLPRSGSTLLCNVLCQNPRLHCTHTSGCLDVIFGVRNNWDKLIEHRSHPDDDKKVRVLRGILTSYYEDVNKPVVLDKSRGWLAYLEMVEQLLGRKAKVVVPVRSISEVLSSLEKLHRKTSATTQPPGESELYFQMQTVVGRCSYWFSQNQVVGLAFNRLVDAIRRGYRDRMFFVRYEMFTSQPKKVLKELYDFLEEPLFEHEINNVKQVTWENDELHGYKGLHDIRGKIEPNRRQASEILGEELTNNYLSFDRHIQ